MPACARQHVPVMPACLPAALHLPRLPTSPPPPPPPRTLQQLSGLRLAPRWPCACPPSKRRGGCARPCAARRPGQCTLLRALRLLQAAGGAPLPLLRRLRYGVGSPLLVGGGSGWWAGASRPWLQDCGSADATALASCAGAPAGLRRPGVTAPNKQQTQNHLRVFKKVNK